MAVEKLVCPAEYQERLTDALGTNQYGEPLFLIAWSQTHTFRAGGIWDFDHYAGYREVYTATGSPICPKQGYWMILEWEPPTSSEAVYNFLNRDEMTGLQSLGPWSPSGRYNVALKLLHKEMVNGELKLSAVELDGWTLDFIMPIIRQAKEMSLEKRMAQAETDRIRAEQKQHKEIEAVAHSVRAPFQGRTAASFAGQRNRNVSVAQRIDLLEKQWAWAMKNPRTVRKGFSTGAFAH